LWDKHRRGISLSKLDIAVSLFIIVGVAIEVLNFNPSESYALVVLRSWVSSEVSGFILGVISTCLIFAIIYLLTKHRNFLSSLSIKREQKVATILPEDDVEEIEGIQIHLFFPNGTLIPKIAREAVDYHAKNLRYKLIVNSKTEPYEAWYMSHPASYGWRLLEKFPDSYVSEWYNAGTRTQDDEVTAKWCTKKKFKLIPQDAKKGDLLKSS
jgi:hypothetical protein